MQLQPGGLAGNDTGAGVGEHGGDPQAVDVGERQLRAGVRSFLAQDQPRPDRPAAQVDQTGCLGDPGVDAAILGQLLRADLLPEAWIAPPAVRQLRALLRHRAGVVRLRTLLRNRIHAVLADFGYDRPGGYWSGVGRDWLRTLELPTVSRDIVEDCLVVIDGLDCLVDRLDAEVHDRAKADPRVKVLTALPGVGEFTGLVILAEIGDVTRFPSARKLASWAGLTPTVRGSDLVVRHGHISKQGSAWLRWILCEAAQTAKRHPEFAASYAAISKRRGKKIATTAVARKLLTRGYHLLTDAAAEPASPPSASRTTGMCPRTGRVTKPRASSQNRMSRPISRAR